MDIAELLAFAVKNRASDLHLSAGLPPMIRVHGDIRRINLPPMEHEDVHAMVYDIMSDAQRKTYEEMLECDFSFGIPNLARFRVNAFNQERGAAVAFRTIPSKVLSLEELAAPRVFAELTNRPRGLILVTGPTGSGKSTTLAAMTNHVNENEYGHILTIEDPIEFLHESKKCLINQREVGPHTLSFANDKVCGPTSRWLIRHFFDSCRNSIGSSMVRMCPYSFSLTWLVIAASVVDLPEPVGPVHKIKPRGLLVISAKIFGVASSSSESTFEGIVRNATAAPRSWLYALTRNRARLGMPNEKSHSSISS